MTEFDPDQLAEPVHVFELRALEGSREMLLLAAYDLLEATPGFDVRRRSSAWTTPARDGAPGFLSLGVRVHSPVPPAEIVARAREIEARLGGAPVRVPAARPVAVDLLWSSAAEGDVAGRVLPDPALATRASAAVLVWQVASGIKDRAGQPLERFLDTAPPPLPERPRGVRLVPRFEAYDAPGERVLTTWAADRAELLAAAATVFGALAGDPGEVRARVVAPLAVPVPAEAGDHDRLFRWLRGVADVVAREGLRMTRAVVFDDGPEHVAGAVLGDAVAGGVAAYDPLVTRVEPDAGAATLRATFSVRARAARP